MIKIIGPEHNRTKAVPSTQTVVFQTLVAAAVGIGILVTGILRLREIGALTWGGMAMPLVGLFLLGVAAFVARDFPAARKLDTQGEVAAGKVTAKWTKRDSDDDRQCFLGYTYGEGQEAYQKVSWKYYRQIEVEAVVSVRYLPADPSLSRLEGEWYR